MVSLCCESDMGTPSHHPQAPVGCPSCPRDLSSCHLPIVYQTPGVQVEVPLHRCTGHLHLLPMLLLTRTRVWWLLLIDHLSPGINVDIKCVPSHGRLCQDIRIKTLPGGIPERNNFLSHLISKQLSTLAHSFWSK